MQKVSSMVSRNIGDYLTNVKTWKNVMYNVLENGLVGDGTTDDTTALQTLINTAIAAGRRTIFFPHTETGGEYYITSLTNTDQVDFVGDNCTFVGGYTGTITDFGAVAALQAETVTNIVNVQTGFGVVGDKTADDTDAIMAAVTAASLLASAGKTVQLYFPHAAGYKTTSPIVVPAGISVWMEAPIFYFGSEDETALTIGEADISNIDLKHKLNVSREGNLSDWTDENCVGIHLINAISCNIEIVQSYGFTIGVQCIGHGAGFSYNHIELGEILNNKIAINGTNRTGDVAGWFNENLFVGGRFSCFSGVNVGLSRYGVRIASQDGTYTNNNNNVFLKPSFELRQSLADPGEAIPVLMEHGNGNSFIKCRSESNHSTIFVRETNASSENTYDIGFGTGAVDNSTDTYPTAVISSQRLKLLESVRSTVFVTPALHKVACIYNGSTQVNVPCVHVAASSSATVFKGLDSFTINADYLTVGSGRGVGVFVDTRIVKKFVVRRDVEAAFPGRISIRCYDASGNVLDNSGANHPYVKGYSHNVPSYISQFGGTYRTGTDTPGDFYFIVHEDVKKITVLITAGSSELRIRSFSIHTVESDGAAAVHPGYEEIIPGVNLGTAVPTAGTWAKGRVVLNDNKSELGTAGSKYVIDAWECVTAGTPGTWLQKRSLTGN